MIVAAHHKRVARSIRNFMECEEAHYTSTRGYNKCRRVWFKRKGDRTGEKSKYIAATLARRGASNDKTLPKIENERKTLRLIRSTGLRDRVFSGVVLQSVCVVITRNVCASVFSS